MCETNRATLTKSGRRPPIFSRRFPLALLPGIGTSVVQQQRQQQPQVRFRQLLLPWVGWVRRRGCIGVLSRARALRLGAPAGALAVSLAPRCSDLALDAYLDATTCGPARPVEVAHARAGRRAQWSVQTHIYRHGAHDGAAHALGRRAKYNCIYAISQRRARGPLPAARRRALRGRSRRRHSRQTRRRDRIYYHGTAPPATGMCDAMKHAQDGPVSGAYLLNNLSNRFVRLHVVQLTVRLDRVQSTDL